MLPLIESLVDQRVKWAYSRRATMVYTPAPPKSKKIFNAAKESQKLPCCMN